MQGERKSKSYSQNVVKLNRQSLYDDVDDDDNQVNVQLTIDHLPCTIDAAAT